MKKIIFILILIFLINELSASAGSSTFSEAESLEAQEILRLVENSIVLVNSTNGRRQVASGVVVEPGLIITSNLIASRKNASITVKTTANKTYPAKLIAFDHQRGLALLRLENATLPPIKTTRTVSTGQWCAIISAYYDTFPAIFTGIISSASANKLLLNAPAAPGSAGGAVVNQHGELIGILRGNVSYSNRPDYIVKNLEAEVEIHAERFSGNISYALPVEQVLKILPALKSGKSIQKGWLGIELEGEACIVKNVLKKSPAEEAGLQKNDLIIAVNGKNVGSAAELIAELENFNAEEQISITVQRDNKRVSLKVKLAAYPGFSPKITIPELNFQFDRDKVRVFDFSRSRFLGVEVLEMTPELLAREKIKEDGGLLVSRIAKNSPAEKQGLQIGDILLKAGDKKLKTTADLRQALKELKDEQKISLTVFRNGKIIKVEILPEKSADLSWVPATVIDVLSRVFSPENLAALQEEFARAGQEIEKELAAAKKELEIELRRQEENLKEFELELRKKKELEKREVERKRREIEEKKTILI